MELKLIDTHSHYDDDMFDGDRDKLITEMLEESVDGIVAIGCTLERSAMAVELAVKYDRVYAAVGIHPEDSYKLPRDYLDKLKTLAANDKVRAIGEIGLDYHSEGFKKKIQQSVFREQIELARELNLPIVVHSRDATADTIEILKEYKPRGVVHCYSGSAETAREILALGMYISFTGVLTFKNAKKAVEACEIVPLDRLMLETDCPYMAPVPFRGKRCDSSMVINIAEKVAEIKKIPLKTVVETCNENAVEFFKMK